MKREEYDRWVVKNLTPKQVALVNTNIYSHPDHIEYWSAYKEGKYDECKTYLQAHTNILDKPRGVDERANMVAEKMIEMGRPYLVDNLASEGVFVRRGAE